MHEADIPGRDLPPPGEPFPGWELLAPMLRPRNASVFSLLERPIVIWDEPDRSAAAAERLWKRLEQIEPLAGLRPGRVFFRWEELERQAAAARKSRFSELEIGGRHRRREPARTSPPGPP